MQIKTREQYPFRAFVDAPESFSSFYYVAFSRIFMQNSQEFWRRLVYLCLSLSPFFVLYMY